VRQNLRLFERGGSKVFEDILRRAHRLKTEVGQLFAERGIAVQVTGESTLKGLPVFPIGTLRFIVDKDRFGRLSPAQRHWDASATEVTFRNDTVRLALMLRGIYPWQGLGVVTAAHDDDMISALVASYADIADEMEGLFPLEREHK
jgi:glutamate-1-semialdehyde aminotransferase